MRYEDMDATVVNVNAQRKTCRCTLGFIRKNLKVCKLLQGNRKTKSYECEELVHFESQVICIDMMRYNKMDGVSVRTLLQARCLHSTSPFLRMLSLVSWVVCVDTSPPVFFKAFITSPVLCHPMRGSRTCLLAHTTPAGSSWGEWWGDGVDLPLPMWMT